MSNIDWTEIHKLGYTSEDDRKSGRNIGYAIFSAGLSVFFLIGYFAIAQVVKMLGIETPSWPFVIGTGLLWVGIYLMYGIKFLEQRDFIVIERFGRFYRVALRGVRLLCFPGLIDKIVKKGTLEYLQLNLYEDAEGQEVDFKDGTAAIEGHAFYRIISGGTDTDTTAHILRFTYEIVDPLGRLRNLLDNLIRGRLQAMTIDQASKQKDGMWDNIKSEGEISQLKQIGLELDDSRGIIITDIKLPEAIVKFRQQKLQGKADAERSTARGRGYSDSIRILQNKLGISAQEAIALYNTQTGMELLREVKPGGMTFVAPGMQGVLASFDIKQNTPSERT